jgi:hypothetical protein
MNFLIGITAIFLTVILFYIVGRIKISHEIYINDPKIDNLSQAWKKSKDYEGVIWIEHIIHGVLITMTIFFSLFLSYLISSFVGDLIMGKY